ncbi:MAG: hypothetical protein D6753_00875 [Planctomycetota bacterium]|nr:MAG: hypothetical protein D6753_00875 [Planctomycetota bacterium]
MREMRFSWLAVCWLGALCGIAGIAIPCRIVAQEPAAGVAGGNPNRSPSAASADAASSDETSAAGEAGADEKPEYPTLAEKYLKQVEATFGEPPGMVRLHPHYRVWVDRDKKRVVVDGYVALTAGQLEMFACLAGTKEHESVVAVFSKAQLVHAGLLAIGAKQGTPVQWEPDFKPPTGSEIQVFVLWKDPDGTKKHIDARKWVRQVGTEDKTLETNWVFAGSSFWTDPDTGKQIYLAESGDLICVSNFTTATLDIPMKSTQVNSGLMFAAFTERIPERGTPVRLVLQLLEPKKSADARANIEKRQAKSPADAPRAEDDQF